jgi:multidrug efflux system membrane fusion protein
MATVTLDDTRGAPKRTERKGTRKGLVIRLAITVLLLALVGGGIFTFNKMRQQGTAAYFANAVPPPTPVTAVAATAGPLPQFLEGIGSLTAVRQVKIAPELAGRVSKLEFDAGDTVHAGDPLVRLNDEIEQADLATYQAQARLAQADLARTQKLASRDFAAQATVDQNKAQLDQAAAGIARNEALIDQKLIKAPFDGQLGIRQVELGQYVSPGMTLVMLTQLDQMFVDFTLPEETRGQLKPGAEVEVRVDAFPGEVFEARLSTIDPQIDPGTRTIQLQATLDNPGHRLLPGMFANARLVLPPLNDVVTVPETAVTQTLYGDSVFLVETGKGQDGKPAQKAVQTFVQSGAVRDGRIAIEKGVKAGDLVIESGQLKLQNGAAVAVSEGTGLVPPSTPPVQ